MCKRTTSNTEYGGGGGGGGVETLTEVPLEKEEKEERSWRETPSPVALEDIKQDMTVAAEKTKTLSGDLLVALVTSTW